MPRFYRSLTTPDLRFGLEPLLLILWIALAFGFLPLLSRGVTFPFGAAILVGLYALGRHLANRDPQLGRVFARSLLHRAFYRAH